MPCTRSTGCFARLRFCIRIPSLLGMSSTSTSPWSPKRSRSDFGMVICPLADTFIFSSSVFQNRSIIHPKAQRYKPNSSYSKAQNCMTYELSALIFLLPAELVPKTNWPNTTSQPIQLASCPYELSAMSFTCLVPCAVRLVFSNQLNQYNQWNQLTRKAKHLPPFLFPFDKPKYRVYIFVYEGV